MEHAPAENSQHITLSTSEVDHHLEDKVPNLPNNDDTELNITVDDIRHMKEVIAATGKFCALSPNLLPSGADEGELDIWDLAKPAEPDLFSLLSHILITGGLRQADLKTKRGHA